MAVRFRSQSDAQCPASIRETKARLPAKLPSGWRYRLVVAMLVSAFLIVNLLPRAWQSIGYFVCVLAFLLIRRWRGEASGRLLDLFRAGRTRLVAGGWSSLFLAACFLSDWLVRHGHTPLGPIYVALAMAPVTALGDWLWVGAYRADLAEGR